MNLNNKVENSRYLVQLIRTSGDHTSGGPLVVTSDS